MVRHAGSPTGIVHVAVTLTRSKDKVRSLTFWPSKIALFYVPPPLFWRGAHNWWVITTVWDLVYSFSEPDFWISPQLSVTRVTSKFARCWYHQNPLSYISERELMFTFDICCRPSVCRLSVCLSACLSVVVMLVHLTQAVIIFGNISMALGILAIHWHPRKILWRSFQGNSCVWGVKHKRGSQL